MTLATKVKKDYLQFLISSAYSYDFGNKHGDGGGGKKC